MDFFVAGPLVAGRCDGNSGAAGRPVWDVGRLTANTEQTRTFAVRNAGSAPLRVPGT